MIRPPLIRCRRLGQSLAVIILGWHCLAHAGFAADLPDVPPIPADQLTKAISSSDLFNGRQALKSGKTDDVAVKFFTAGAAQGNPVAESYLGYLAYIGRGMKQDDVLAASWFQKAAEHGYAEAQIRLGLMHTHPRKLTDPARSLMPDLKAASHWLHLAADQGSALALDEFGLLTLQDASHADHISAARALFQQSFHQGSGESAKHMCESYQAAPKGPATAGEAASAEAHRWCQLADINMPLVDYEDTAAGRLMSPRIVRSKASHE